MWRPIDKENYMKRVVELKPIESFSDPDGVSPYGKGCPWMETIWGKDDERILKCITSKVDRHQEQWDEYYFEAIQNKTP